MVLLRNPHVGEILQYEFLEELDINANSLAESLRLPYLSIQQIIQVKAPMIADIDLRLCRYFGLSDGYFVIAQRRKIDKKAKADKLKK